MDGWISVSLRKFLWKVRCMDGWIEGWIDECMDGWIVFVVSQMYGWMDEWIVLV